ncbi:hypothetical protein FHJ31_00405 [Pseudomonas sp. Fig-3]|nr:hypothetical protein FHJ31_00405 [Pseudomonas sp. Fig-3]
MKKPAIESPVFLSFKSTTIPPVGASLLAMAPDHPTSLYRTCPPSRAGSLPQGLVLCPRIVDNNPEPLRNRDIKSPQTVVLSRF